MFYTLNHMKKIYMSFVNNWLRKLALVALMTVLAVGAAGCSKNSGKDEGVISIVCTIFPQYDFVKQITKDCENVSVTMLMKPGQEVHDYDPSSKDILSIHNADVFIYVGGESDSWIEDVLKTVENEDLIKLSLMDMIDDVVLEESVGGESDSDHDHEDEDDDDHDHGEEYDEHVWTSPANAAIITQKISDELANIEGIDVEKVKAATAAYIEELDALDAEFKSVVAEAEVDTIIVADRFPLRYFCDEYGLEYFAAFSGCATSVEPSSATLIFLIDKVNELNLSYIYQVEMSAGATAKQVAEETGAEILTFYSCHNITSDQWNNGTDYVTYVDMMKMNVESLKKSLDRN